MQSSIFRKQTNHPEDKIEKVLKSISQIIITVVFGLLPLLFVPLPFLPTDYVKILVVIVGSLLAIIFFSLSVLRSGKVRISMPIALWSFWGIAIIAIISAVLSGDMRDSFVGDAIEVHTALFVLVLALVVTLPSVMEQSKMSIMRLYILLTSSAAILALFHVSRLFLGSDFLSLGVFNGSVSTPVGGWNDLALFFGLSILLSLVALEQLPLTRWGKVIFSVGITLSLAMLAVINFFAVWIVLALVSLVMLMYGLTKDRFSENTLAIEGKKNVSVHSILLSIVVFSISLVFIIGGSGVGGTISKITNISYVEVRPSFEATVDIARSVYAQNAFLGIGPNKFVDAWRMYKDPAINQTVFWATDFRGGSGYIITLFATTGIFGIITWVVFFGLFLMTGFRMLFKTTHADRFWYFIGSSSFVAAIYLWGMSLIYVPGATILLLAALFTGLTFVSYSSLVDTRGISLSVLRSRRAAFVLVGVVMVIIVASSSALYYVGKQYSSIHTYGNAVTHITSNTSVNNIEQSIVAAYASSKNDAYARQIASYQLSKMNTIIGLSELTQQQQQEFQNAVQNGVNAGQLAVDTDPTDSQNWSVLGSIYSVLAAAGVEGAKDRAQEAFALARTYDPTNPSYALLEAQLHLRTNDLESARTAVQEAISLKPNYTDALFFLTQLDIAEGNTDAAIATTLSIISLEPRNAARYYQLGVLQSSLGDVSSAIVAFEQAVSLDNDYANARYFLALSYMQTGQVDQALEQLERVQTLNPGNEQVSTLISQIKSGSVPEVESSAIQQIEEPETVTQTEDGIITTEAPDTSLITPVNTVGDSEDVTGETSVILDEENPETIEVQ